MLIGLKKILNRFMKKLKIITYGHPTLRQKAKPVLRFDKSLKALAEAMIETMHKADGIGLAAPQVGKSMSLFVVDISAIEKGHQPMIFVNPEITETSGSCAYHEGCLSVPGVSSEVIRPEKIKLRYADLDGNFHEGVADGILARVIQHEYDHLQGVLFVDYLNEQALQEYEAVLKKLEKHNQDKKPTASSAHLSRL